MTHKSLRLETNLKDKLCGWIQRRRRYDILLKYGNILSGLQTTFKCNIIFKFAEIIIHCNIQINSKIFCYRKSFFFSFSSINCKNNYSVSFARVCNFRLNLFWEVFHRPTYHLASNCNYQTTSNKHWCWFNHLVLQFHYSHSSCSSPHYKL